MELEKLENVNLLFDFYGILLTDRQREIMELYYREDFSLGEIASKYKISRQAVYDALKRSEKTLKKYEKKLKLLDKHDAEKQKIGLILKKLSEWKCAPEKTICEIKSILEDILNLNYR